jgi:DNA repair protein RadA/Sms
VAIASSALDRAVQPRTAVIGEVGLGGELRPAQNVERRLSVAESLGFSRVVVPKLSSAPRTTKLSVIQVATLTDALHASLSPKAAAGRERSSDDDAA